MNIQINCAASIATVVLASIATVSAHASLFDDRVDARESAEAVTRCAEEAKNLLSDGEYLLTVTGKHQKVSAKVDTKRYTFQAASGGGFGPPPTLGNTLYVDVKVTQPSDEFMDAPASDEWSCTLQKK